MDRVHYLLASPLLRAEYGGGSSSSDSGDGFFTSVSMAMCLLNVQELSPSAH